MNITEPLAKSKPPLPLRVHTEDVMQAAAEMARLLREPLSEVAPAHFADMLRTAAFFHDLGKAAQGFQEVLLWKGAPKDRPQWGYRHEALSAVILLACLPEDIEPSRKLTLVAAVLTHHKNLDDEKLTAATGRGNLYGDFHDYRAGREWRKKILELRPHWEWVCREVESNRATGVVPINFRALPDDPTKLPDLWEINKIVEQALQSVQGLSLETVPWILARGFLMGADHLASAGRGKPLGDLPWENLEKARKPEGFQTKMAETCGSVLLEAPTGSGKTEAALYWAKYNRRGGERIFYVLPYQASINKMAERLTEIFGPDNVGFLHGRAALQEFAYHFDEESSNYEEAAQKAKKRVDDTKQFYRPVKVITPYQLLKLLFGAKFFEIGLAELLGGLVIFDEIHAYDAHVGALLDVMLSRLQTLKVRFCFMSATFPPFLRQRLYKELGEMPVISLDSKHKRDAELAATARHKLKFHDKNLEELIENIRADAKSQKVLVVCNRIQQAQDIYQALDDGSLKVTLLHSRFIARDRANLENDLIEFPGSDDAVKRQIPKADILVATQVVEVSLNLSFDTIYTEAAPVDALLQRFGRVNRMNQHKKPVAVNVACQFEEEKIKHVYSLERIAATLSHACDESELDFQTEGEWVKNTYLHGFTEEEKKEYQEAFTAFTETVERLRPFYKGDDKDYYDLFDNYPVVPIRFRAAYRACIQDKQFFNAAKLVASLSQPTFFGMNQHCQADKKNHVYYAVRRYDDRLGLLNEAEPDKSYQQDEWDDVCV